ncbi:MAG TPA: CopG family transcriptional regulator [Thermoanaerobaculia bacterium]|nr:CopG family transcriptional regulator [Thermoanaerobaculia bacterium]
MKRLQVMIEEELDAALARKAGVEGTSKAALIRRYVRERLKPLPPPEADPLWQMAGVDDYEPEAIDDVVYG